ncbi:MAG: putative ABC transporter permease, partial [Lachnospiraceae bacterium]|nr:putative ABC transporter permease [Lachnospiraceae bacterium]
MDKYLTIEWIFIFCVYSVIGFIWETIYCSIRERQLVNRGFMKGPFLPIYGSGVC